MIACQMGWFRAVPRPSTKVNTRRLQGVVAPRRVSTPRMLTAISMMASPTINSLRRSTMSARAPDGSPSKNTGRLVAVCISAMNTGEGVSVVINQTPPTFCIHTPRLAASEAIQSARKTGTSSGLHTDACTARWSSIAHL